MTLLSTVIGLEAATWRTRTTAGGSVPPIHDPSDDASDSVADSQSHQAMWLNEILARPLFTPGRQADVGGIQGLPRLTGIIVAGSQRLALFATSVGRPVAVVKAGGYFGDYEVQTITERGVTVGGPRGKLFLMPSFAPVGLPDPPAPAPFPDPLRRVPPGLLMSQ